MINHTELHLRLQTKQSFRQIAREMGVDEKTVRKHAKRSFPELAESRMKHGIPEKRVLIIDIETRPALAYVWGVWNVNIAPQQIVEDKDIISFAARWAGTDKTVFYSDFHTGHDVMVQAAWELLDEADVVVHYNGVKFDIPHINQCFALAGLEPPSGYYQLDLLKSVRRDFNFTSNKLDNIIRQFGIGAKVEHEGFALWTKCLAGDPKAWAKMKQYNIHDVVETEALYNRLKPWVGVITHPKRYAVHHKKVGGLI
jgi:hypothetical protein